jgi:hypothetical protein
VAGAARRQGRSPAAARRLRKPPGRARTPARRRARAGTRSPCCCSAALECGKRQATKRTRATEGAP